MIAGSPYWRKSRSQCCFTAANVSRLCTQRRKREAASRTVNGSKRAPSFVHHQPLKSNVHTSLLFVAISVLRPRENFGFRSRLIRRGAKPRSDAQIDQAKRRGAVESAGSSGGCAPSRIVLGPFHSRGDPRWLDRRPAVHEDRLQSAREGPHHLAPGVDEQHLAR